MLSIYQTIVKLCIQWELPEEVQQLIYNKFKTQVLSHRIGDMENDRTLGPPIVRSWGTYPGRPAGYSEWSEIPRSYEKYFRNLELRGFGHSLERKVWIKGRGRFERGHGWSDYMMFQPNSYINLHPLKLSVISQGQGGHIQQICDFQCNMPEVGNYSKAGLYELCEEAGLPYKKHWNRTKLLELLLNY